MNDLISIEALEKLKTLVKDLPDKGISLEKIREIELPQSLATVPQVKNILTKVEVELDWYAMGHPAIGAIGLLVWDNNPVFAIALYPNLVEISFTTTYSNIGKFNPIKSGKGFEGKSSKKKHQSKKEKRMQGAVDKAKELQVYLNSLVEIVCVRLFPPLNEWFSLLKQGTSTEWRSESICGMFRGVENTVFVSLYKADLAICSLNVNEEEESAIAEIMNEYPSILASWQIDSAQFFITKIENLMDLPEGFNFYTDFLTLDDLLNEQNEELRSRQEWLVGDEKCLVKFDKGNWIVNKPVSALQDDN